MEGQVIFDSDYDYDLTQNNIVFSKPQKKKQQNVNLRSKKGLINPYMMNHSQVRLGHFCDARLYDSDITEPGWSIPKRIAKQKYQKWINSVRKNPGWENFRRKFCPILEEEEGIDQEGNIYTTMVRKHIPMNKLTDDEVWKRFNGDVIVRKLPVIEKKTIELMSRKDLTRNKKSHVLPQSRDKGIDISDEDFRPKMFTEKMGREISQIRTKLGLTQSDLGKKINVESNTIKNIEIGGIVTFNPEDAMVRALARALDVPSIKYQE